MRLVAAESLLSRSSDGAGVVVALHRHLLLDVDDAAAGALALGAHERLGRAPEHVGGVLGVRRAGGDAERGVERLVDAVHAVGDVVGAHLLELDQGALGRRARQGDGVLVAADAGDHGVGAEAAGEGALEGREHPVAGLHAEARRSPAGSGRGRPPPRRAGGRRPPRRGRGRSLGRSTAASTRARNSATSVMARRGRSDVLLMTYICRAYVRLLSRASVDKTPRPCGQSCAPWPSRS